MKKIHYTDRYLLNPYHPVTVFVIGAGGTGSQVATGLARMSVALQALGHPGLHVTVFDPDTVTEANIGRQLFSGSELGLKVLGYGEDKTPVSLVRSCSVFLYADRKENKVSDNTPEFFIRRDMEYFDKAFEQAADGKGEVSLSLIGGALKKMMPKFKVRRYGCKTLGKLYERLDRYELVMTDKGVASAVRLKD